MSTTFKVDGAFRVSVSFILGVLGGWAQGTVPARKRLSGRDH